MKYPQIISAFILFAGLFLFNETNAQAPCTFTYAQGFNVGCQIAQAANASGCYSQLCSTPYLHTLRDFQADCPEYVAGVIEGFVSCNNPPPPMNNVPNDPTDPGNNINDAPCEAPIYVSGNWVCP